MRRRMKKNNKSEERGKWRRQPKGVIAAKIRKRRWGWDLWKEIKVIGTKKIEERE